MSGSARLRPLIGIITSTEFIAPQHYQVTGEKYIDAIQRSAGGVPFLIPSLKDPLPVHEILAPVDGILITGAHSNVKPEHYGQAMVAADTATDPRRDLTTLPLFPAAVAAGVPFLAICLGFQEMNVAFGGTLHQTLHQVPGRLDHREDEQAALPTRYEPAHGVSIARNGVLAELFGETSFPVNSLHGQGVDALGPGLSVEAVAEDGTIEAVSVASAESFALGVQWHPEWQSDENPQSTAIFQAFGDACRSRMQN